MGTWIVGLAIVAAVYFAARHVLRVHKNGGCVGCNEGGGCSHCHGGGEKVAIHVPPSGKAKVRKVPPCCQGK